MAEADVRKEAEGTNRVQQGDGLPVVDSSILKEKRVLLIRDLDVETVLAGLKPFLYYSHLDDINAEANRGSKTDKLVDVLEKPLSVNEYDLFYKFLKIVGGTQPDLFYELVGRVPSEEEADFCVQTYAESLRQCIKDQGHCTDSLLDEEIKFDSEHVQLAIVKDNLHSHLETYDELPHRYQTHQSEVQGRDGNVSAVDILNDEPRPRRVSLYGRAGTGKTTTFQWLAREWSFKRWAPQFTLLFLLQFRMLSACDHHMTAIELLTLACLYPVTKAGLNLPLSSWLKHAAGRVLVLIDGLDEVAGFQMRLYTCPIISDLNQKAHPLDLCFNILRGNLFPGVTFISASRQFAGLNSLQVDKKFEILGLTEPRIKEFVECKHPSKAADIMSVLINSPLLMSVCSITFYCALISRLLADGVIFPQEDLQTYTRLMSFLIVQCVERKLPEWSFPIQVGPYFNKLANMAYIGVVERQLKREISTLVFNDYDLSQAGLTPQDLKSIQEAGLLQLQKTKVGLRSSITAEFFHFSAQELLASAYLLPQFPDNILEKLFSGGQFNMALMYLFGLQYDTGSNWIKDIRHSVNPTGEAADLLSIPGQAVVRQMDDFIQSLCDQCITQTGFMSQLQLCQLLYEGQMEVKAKDMAYILLPGSKLSISDTQMTLIDLMAVWFVCKYANFITEIALTHCGLTDTLIRFVTSSFLKVNIERLFVLDLAGNMMGVIGAEAIAEWLKQNHRLGTLNLPGNNMGDNGTAAIAAALQTNTTLQTLNVDGNNIGENGAAAIAAALQTNTTLQALDVADNDIGVNGAVAIAATLHTNTTLRTLNVADNNIGDDGAAAIAAVLKTNTTLHTLDVGISNIGETGATAIAVALQNNTSLQTLDVCYNDIGDDGAKAIASVLKNNRALQLLNISYNNIRDTGIKALMGAKHPKLKIRSDAQKRPWYLLKQLKTPARYL